MVGEDDGDGEEDDQCEGGLVVREDEWEGVHGSVKDDYRKKVAARAIIEPGEDDSDGNQEDNADKKIGHQSEPKRAVKIERCVPEGPGKPDQKARDEWRETLLEAGEEKAAPAGLFEGGGEE